MSCAAVPSNATAFFVMPLDAIRCRGVGDSIGWIWIAPPPHGEYPSLTIKNPCLCRRLIVFISSLEHEVLPAWRERFALTAWMFNRRDTALEVMTETLRQKKEAGTLKWVVWRGQGWDEVGRVVASRRGCITKSV